jgi:hypothetical protein
MRGYILFKGIVRRVTRAKHSVKHPKKKKKKKKKNFLRQLGTSRLAVLFFGFFCTGWLLLLWKLLRNPYRNTVIKIITWVVQKTDVTGHRHRPAAVGCRGIGFEEQR